MQMPMHEGSKALITDPELNECLYLVSKGVPFDVAFSLPAEDRFVWAVIFGRFDGGKFDFSKMEFVKDTR
jgi:hypothetical protein